MKTLKRLSLLAVLFAAFSTVTMAQVNATASASALIVQPIAIAWAADMDFGNVAVSTLAGTVVLDPAGARTTTGGVTLPALTGTVTAASFTVTGDGTRTYVITLPAAATTISNGVQTMNVDTWTSNPSGTGTLAAGTQTLNVGATLNVAGSQAPGTYVSGADFTVTVNYN